MKQATLYFGEYPQESLTRKNLRVPLFLVLLIASGLIQGAGLTMLIPLFHLSSPGFKEEGRPTWPIYSRRT